VLGLTGPMIAPLLRIGLFARLRVFAHPLVALPVWAIDLYVWHIPCSTGRASHEACTRSSTPASCWRDRDVDGAARAAAKPAGSATSAGWATSSRSA